MEPATKPELLLPAGSPEALHAALAAGADEVYLGLARFSARGRARNFGPDQLAGAVKLAKEKGVRIYLALNTLVKNSELGEVLDTLYIAAQCGVAAVIVQDWGVYRLARAAFPELAVHASTQMGVHNSAGVAYLAEKGFERGILARELTLPELETIAKESTIALEVFAHGALCYSLSGHCLFSSFLGGQSANRGQCRQPCRRLYASIDTGAEGRPAAPFFSLRDLELLPLARRLGEIGIKALKIEGRMKSAEYVHRVGSAYRIAIDEPDKIEDARALLADDFGRAKTGYFAGGDVSNAFGGATYTGAPLGTIEEASREAFTFTSARALCLRDRLRVLPASGDDSSPVKLSHMAVGGREVKQTAAGDRVTVFCEGTWRRGDRVLLGGTAEGKFPTRMPPPERELRCKLPNNRKDLVLDKLAVGPAPAEAEAWFRIDSLAWLPKVYLQSVTALVLSLTRAEWDELDLSRPFLRESLDRLVAEVPLFIPEALLDDWRARLKRLVDAGVRRFLLQQPAWKLLLPKTQGLTIIAGEHAYSLNDAAVDFLQGEGFASWIYPFEGDFANLENGRDRGGIVPAYFRPRLFVSRMPAPEAGETFTDRSGTYRRAVRDGVTIVVPDGPVSVLQHTAKLLDAGFGRFLVDLSFEKPSQKTFNRLLAKLENSEAELPAWTFNFKQGLA